MSAWIMRLTGVSFLCAAVMSLTPAKGRRSVGIVCGFALASVMLSAVSSLNWDNYALYIQEYMQQGEALAQDGLEEQQIQTRLIIEERCEAYILDKARALGISDCEAAVTARWNAQGYWVPHSCRVSSSADEQGRAQLCAWIEGELGIPSDRLVWTQTEEREQDAWQHLS